MRVLVFGDSIVQGFWDTEGGWVQRLRRRYDAEQVKDFSIDQPTIFNLGISGDVTGGVLKRLEAETRARTWPGQEFAFVIATGLNDSLISGGQPRSTPEIYRAELLQLIEQAQLFSKHLLFVGLTACDEPRSTPVSWGDYHYTNDRIWQFETVLRQVCREQTIPHVLVFERFKDGGAELLIDGLHPNDNGHELIATLVQPALEKILV